MEITKGNHKITNHCDSSVVVLFNIWRFCLVLLTKHLGRASLFVLLRVKVFLLTIFLVQQAALEVWGNKTRLLAWNVGSVFCSTPCSKAKSEFYE